MVPGLKIQISVKLKAESSEINVNEKTTLTEITPDK